MSEQISIHGHKLTISIKDISRNGKTYQYYSTKLTIGKDPSTGKQKQHTYTAKTKEELIQKLVEELGTPVLLPEASIPLASWLDTWINTYGTRCYKPATINSYRYRSDTLIKPELGHIPIKELDEFIISDFYKKLEEGGRSISYVLDIHHLLQQALKYAVCKHYLNFNPCDTVPLKKRPYVKPSILSPEECIQFRKLIANDLCGNILGVLLGTGLRIGEAVGLSWDFVDLERKKIYVRNQITDIKGENGKGIVHLWQESTKNGTAHTIYFSNSTAEYLRKQKEKQAKEKRDFGEAWTNEHNLVFTMPDGSQMKAKTVERHFKAAAKLLGREDLVVHSLRHTAASAAYSKTHNIRFVQDMLGQNSPRTTAHYTTVLEEALIQQADAIDAYMGNTLSIDFDNLVSEFTSVFTPD